jgi:exosortase
VLRTLARLNRWADRHYRVVIAVLMLLAVSCFGPWVSEHLSHLWKRQHYQFYPMMVVALAGIAVSRWASVPGIDSGATTRSIRPQWKFRVSLLLLMIICLAAASWLNSPWFGTVACLTFVIMIVRNCGDLYPVAMPLLLLIPLPFALDTNLIAWLQRVSSSGASALLDLAEIRHLMSGNVLELPHRKLFVEEACSGIGSVFLMLATAAVYAVWKRMRTVVAIPLLVSAIVWAVAGNTFRIFIVALSDAKHGPDLSHGLPHELLGMATYCLSILMLILTEQALLFMFEPIAEQQSNDKWMIKYGDSVSTSLIHFWNWRTSSDANFLSERANSRGVAGIAMSPVMFTMTLIPILAIFSAVTGWRFWPQSFAAPVAQAAATLPQPTNSKLESIPKDVFTKATAVPQLLDCATETRKNVSDHLRLGAHSKMWQLKISGGEVSVSIDGSFESWCDARSVFLDEGWKILRSEAVASPGIGNESSVVACTEFYRSDGDRLLLLFGDFGSKGATVSMPANTDLFKISKRLSEQQLDVKEETWQFQMVVPHFHEMDSPTRTFWTQTYLEMFEIILDRWRSQP